MKRSLFSFHIADIASYLIDTTKLANTTSTVVCLISINGYSLAIQLLTILLSQCLERKKDKLRRGHATAKQRLGKLLKLDKLTGRYIR